jgi:hypothetical protein
LQGSCASGSTAPKELLAHASRSESYQGNHKYLGPGSLSVAYSVNQLVHREAITHAQLDHPNIIPFLGVYRENTEGPPMTVLPFIERIFGLRDRRRGYPWR